MSEHPSLPSGQAGVSSLPRSPNPFRFFLDHNPCFLVSALLMFLGCYLINSALDVRTGDTGKALELLAAINLYEIALLVLGIALLRRTSWNRDGVLLLLIEMLFLTDAPFLLAQIAMAKEMWLSGFNIALFLLAILKAGLAIHALGIPVRARTLGFLLLQLAFIYCGLPLFFSDVSSDGVIGAAPMYLAWWAVGLLPLAYDLVARVDPIAEDGGSHRFVRRAYLVVPWLLLIAHLAFFQYAYRSPFYAADLSPVLLGMAIATLRLKPSKRLPASDLWILRTLFPILAVCFALPAPVFEWQTSLVHFHIEAQWATLGAAGLVLAYCFHMRFAVMTLAAYGLLLIAHHFGPQPSVVVNAVANWIADSIGKMYRVATWFVPQTTVGWGVLAIIGAFGLLGLGGWYALRRPAEAVAAGR